MSPRLLPLALVSATLLAFAAPLNGSTTSVDDASRYTPGSSGVTRWMSNGHRGDYGFGVWSFEAVAESWAAAGRFIGNSTAGAGDINRNGQSFALFAQPTGFPNPTAAAIRRFAKPALSTGDSISFQVAVNYRNGNKGLVLRDTTGVELWNFDVRSGGYSIRNGPSESARDDGSRFGSYHANTIFTFTFTQRERQMDWTILRSGGINATVSGNFSATAATVADIRFYISGTESSDARNNLYFNNFLFTPAVRGDAPLTLGERRLPGFIASHFLRFTDPTINNTANATVTMRHGGDNFATSYSLAKGGDGVWSIDIRNVLATPGGQPLQPGWHEFKFRPNSNWESGDNRWLYIDPQGRIALPPTVYLYWQRDPTSTMTVGWFNDSASQNKLRYRVPGAESWISINATTQPFPHAERFIQTAEITGLNPDWIYEFQVDGYSETYKCRTMPATLGSRSVTFAIGGDVGVGATADAVTAAAAAKNPDFFVIGGDHAYEDAKAENFWMWKRYMESFHRHARTPDGRLIPLVVGIGNHEVLYGFGSNHPDFDDSAAWRDRYTSYYYRTFAFPGPATPYRALDFGTYLSLLLTDTEHSSPVITGTDPQTQWLATELNKRRAVPHLIPVHHVPAYPTYRSFNEPTSQRIRQHWVPLYEAAGVQLVFENHDHTFKRTKPLLAGVENSNGIRYLGDGLWGIGSRPPDTSRSYLDIANEKHHVHFVTLTSTGRSIEAVDAQGNFFGGRIDQPIDGIPTAPSPSISNLSGNSISLAWNAVPRASRYKVIRSDGREFETGNLTFTDSEWTPGGNFTYVVEAINRSGHSINHPVTRPRPRELWRLAHNLPWNGTGAGADFADPDGNGFVNLQEYFFGLAPGSRDSASAASPHFDSVSNRFGIRYRRNPAATDVTHRFLWKSDLADPAPWAQVTVLDQSEEGTSFRRATIPVDPQHSKSFLKLEVAPNP